jgi:hypothetical protein
MSIVATEIDPISLLLVIGMVLSAGTAIALATGRSQRQTARQRTRQVSIEIGSPASILARANEAARAQSTRARPTGLRLQSVRAVEATGHESHEPDDSQPDRKERRAEITALAFHIAENDPKRMAEVITQWIRTNENANRFGKP